ncbi:MAG: hypothetical protein IKZ07_07730 [Akkermansia sp.]|nr:hypothetical protein [Akkermansia sp.]
MNVYQYITLAAVPALVSPAVAQEQALTVADYIQSQQALIAGATELLNVPNPAESADDVAAALDELSKYAAALVSLKGQLNAEELAAAQGNLEFDPKAQAVGMAFVAAVNKLNDNGFYGSNRLAAAVQNFVVLLGQM